MRGNSDHGQHPDINCFCDYPTPIYPYFQDMHQLTLVTYDTLEFHGKQISPYCPVQAG